MYVIIHLNGCYVYHFYNLVWARNANLANWYGQRLILFLKEIFRKHFVLKLFNLVDSFFVKNIIRLIKNLSYLLSVVTSVFLSFIKFVYSSFHVILLLLPQPHQSADADTFSPERREKDLILLKKRAFTALINIYSSISSSDSYRIVLYCRGIL